jgi:predicted Ser/Thr protein kinase
LEEVARHFPDFEIIGVIGVGGMATVFQARQPRLDRFIALKILSGRLAGDPAFVERFTREARVLARLSHPNIVAVFDCGMAGPFAYFVMEYVDGVNLRQAMQAGRFTSGEALELARDLCRALKYAHEQGILHRDIKPENILIDARGAVKIADFGIAKLMGEKEHGDVTLTREGAVLGSLHYMAPEQFHSPGQVDHRADIYSLGVVLYELLTGELPRGRFLPPSRKSDVDARIDEIVLRTLESEREARYQTVGEMKTRMDAVADSRVGGPGLTDGPREAESPVATSHLPTAHSATLAAVCTGGSFALAALAAAYGMMTVRLGQERPLIPGSEFLVLAVALLLVGAPAVLGILLGRLALLEVRDSKGKVGGYTRSLLAALAWPVVFGFLVPALLGWAVSDVLNFRLKFVHALLIFLPLGGYAAFTLIRRVNRWVKPASQV